MCDQFLACRPTRHRHLSAGEAQQERCLLRVYQQYSESEIKKASPVFQGAVCHTDDCLRLVSIRMVKVAFCRPEVRGSPPDLRIVIYGGAPSGNVCFGCSMDSCRLEPFMKPLALQRPRIAAGYTAYRFPATLTHPCFTTTWDNVRFRPSAVVVGDAKCLTLRGALRLIEFPTFSNCSFLFHRSAHLESLVVTVRPPNYNVLPGTLRNDTS